MLVVSIERKKGQVRDFVEGVFNYLFETGNKLCGRWDHETNFQEIKLSF